MYEIPSSAQVEMIVKDILSYRSHRSLKRKLLAVLMDEFGKAAVLDELVGSIQSCQVYFDAANGYPHQPVVEPESMR